MKYAIINEDNIVINIIEYDGTSKWAPPFNCYIIRSDEAEIGDMYHKEMNAFSKG